LSYSAFDQIKDLAPLLVLTALSSGVVYVVKYFSQEFIIHEIIRICISMLFGLITYLQLCFIFEKDIIKEVKNLIKRK
jgi:hypothetical protein